LTADRGKWRFDAGAGAREIAFRRIGENEITAMDTCRTVAGKTNAALPEPLHGYHFRMAGPVIVAYPAEYGSTGVMTFAATPDGKVYEKDLGPKTLERGRAMSHFRPDQTWKVAEP